MPLPRSLGYPLPSLNTAPPSLCPFHLHTHLSCQAWVWCSTPGPDLQHLQVSGQHSAVSTTQSPQHRPRFLRGPAVNSTCPLDLIQLRAAGREGLLGLSPRKGMVIPGPALEEGAGGWDKVEITILE